MHKTLYLKSSTKSGLIADIAKVVDGYTGDIEFSNGTIHGHWIGKIPNTTDPETGAVLTWLSGWHANLLVPEDFDSSALSTVSAEPSSPVHAFA
jgi:hypothetical protein